MIRFNTLKEFSELTEKGDSLDEMGCILVSRGEFDLYKTFLSPQELIMKTRNGEKPTLYFRNRPLRVIDKLENE